MGSQMRSPKPPTSTTTTKPMVKKKLEKFMSMNGGDGECSYNRMSVVQEYALHGLQPFFSEAVHQMTLPHQPQHQNGQNQLHEEIPCLRIADFGSSTGRNAFLYMEFLVSRIRQEYKYRNLHMPEVQVFFNDLPGNDFNTMFGLLPPMKHEDGESGRIRDYFAAGVPGSFYGRLFPKESLHFAVSLHCLHWISQIPTEVTDPESPLYNRGSCWIMGGKLAIAQAYSEQSKSDFQKFLQCRQVELASGGILYCYMSGRTDFPDPTNQTKPERRHRFLAGPDFEDTWQDLIAEGIVTEETRDAFNLPFYCLAVEEIQESIAKTGGFEVIRLEVLEDLALCPDEMRMNLLQNPKKCAKFYSSWVRSLVEPLMTAHMGSECTDEWFVRHERRIAARCRAMLGDTQTQEDYKFFSADFMLVGLRRL